MQSYTYISDDQTFAFSAENPTGARGGGSRGGDCTKLSPTVTIKPGETVTLAEINGSGVIQNMWFTGYVGHGFILNSFLRRSSQNIHLTSHHKYAGFQPFHHQSNASRL